MKKLVKKKKKLLLAVTAVFFGLIFVSRLILQTNKTASKTQVATTSQAATGPDLHIDIPSLVPPPGGLATARTGQNIDVQVFLKTADSQVKSLDFILPYDATRLSFPNTVDLAQNIEIDPNSGFNPNFVVKRVDTVAKKVIIALTVPSINQIPIPVNSQSDIFLATIKFQVKLNAPIGTVELLPSTTSTIYDLQTKNVIKCVGGFRFTVFQGPTLTPTPTPTEIPRPVGLRFSLRMPDVIASSVPGSDVQIELRDGTNAVGIANIDLVRNGSYFQTAFEIVFTIPQNKAYTVIVKTTTSLRRIFSGVNLTRGTTLDCTVTSNLNCGELISQRDSKLMLTGDSDGFDSASGSYNKVDSADLQQLTIYYNRPAGGQASLVDFNLDGFVDIGDLEILARNYAKTGD